MSIERILLWRSIITVLLILGALTFGIWLADIATAHPLLFTAVISTIAGMAWLPG